MLKKAGIVVATAAAGMLAVSPLAFAGDKTDDHKVDNGHVDNGGNGDDANGGNGDDANGGDFTQIGDGGNNACINNQGAGSGDVNSGLNVLAISGNSIAALNNINALQCVNLLNNNLNDNNVSVSVLGDSVINQGS